jgi:hypothetical protein
VALPTLTDLQAHVTSGTTDDELQNMLDAAVNVVESAVGPLTGTQFTETHYDAAGRLLVLRQSPVIDVLSIERVTWTMVSPLLAAQYAVDPDTGIVRLVDGTLFAGDYRVTYTAGYVNTPSAITQAILIVAAHLVETQRVPGANRPGFGAYGQPETASMPLGVGYAIPNRAQELLQPYLRQPVVA